MSLWTELGDIFWWFITVWLRGAVVLLINAGFRGVHEKPNLSHFVDQGKARVVLTTGEQSVNGSGSRFSLDTSAIVCLTCCPSYTILFLYDFTRKAWWWLTRCPAFDLQHPFLCLHCRHKNDRKPDNTLILVLTTDNFQIGEYTGVRSVQIHFIFKR